jgi:NAD-dependent DNA ligase
MELIKKLSDKKNFWEIVPELKKHELIEIIQLCSDYYHNKGKQLLSDTLFDVITERLKAIDPDAKILKKIGAPAKGRSVKLPYWMGSMNKIKSDDDKLLKKYLQTQPGPYYVSDKLDGISCLLTVTNGRMKLYTRGDGENAQDITHLSSVVKLKFKSSQTFAIRGELIISKAHFNKYYKKKYENVRNLVGGIVNTKSTSIKPSDYKHVVFIAYEVIEPNNKISEQYKFLEKNGFNVVTYHKYNKLSMDKMDEILTERKDTAEYDIDGIIVINNENHKRNTTGNPEYSFAYKGISEIADVTVKSVMWKESKDGYLKPTIHYNKKKLSGATLENATGFNARFIVKHKIGKGTILKIVRSGDTIPHILSIVKGTKPELPQNIKYEWNKTRVDIVLKDIDNNVNVVKKRITKFMKDNGVKNISEGIISKLVDSGYDNIFKIIKLKPVDLMKLEGVQEKMAEKIYVSINSKIRELSLLNLMVGSNLFGRGLAESKIKKVLDEYPKIVNQYESKDKKKWLTKINNIEGFSEISTTQFLDNLPTFIKFYNQIQKHSKIKAYKINNTKSNKMSGEVVVFTGFRENNWKKMIEENGGRVAGTVSGNTTILVHKDGETTSSSYKKAKTLSSVKIYNKTQFDTVIKKLS